ncbi:hypothetical protein [Mycobacterium sp.]
MAQLGMGVVTVAAQGGNSTGNELGGDAWLLPAGDRRGRVLADIARLP